MDKRHVAAQANQIQKDAKGPEYRPGLAANRVSFGEYGIKATSYGRLTSRQIESARRVISRHVRRNGKLWIRVFPDKPITKKPLEVRQGKGKGAVEYWVALIQPGRMIYEVSGISEELAREVLTLASHKLPVGTTFIKRQHS